MVFSLICVVPGVFSVDMSSATDFGVLICGVPRVFPPL
jgi:hypothetical protein